MRVLVTRPDPGGARTAAALRARGCDVLLAPLLMVETMVADLAGEWQAVALTSVNAVDALDRQGGIDALRAVPAYAVGGRTADAVRALGFGTVTVADGTAADLVRVLRTDLRAGARVLYLAGADRSRDLAGELVDAGIEVATRVVYRARAAERLTPAVADALSSGAIDGVLHFSRRSAATFLACAAAVDLSDQALAMRHCCLSPTVAAPLRDAGARRVQVARRPTETDLVDLVTVPPKSVVR